MSRASGGTQVATKRVVDDEVLAMLDNDTNKAIDRIEGRKAVDVGQEFDKLNSELEQASKIKDKEQRNTQMRVAKAKIEDLNQDILAESEDLAQAIMGINGLMTQMGHGYEELLRPSKSETALISGAEQSLAEAQQNRQEAENAWFFKASKIANADAAIEEATRVLADAKVRAAQMARDRLMKANMEDSLNEFMFRVQKTIDIMQNRKKIIEGQIAAVVDRKAKAYKTKQDAAKRLGELDAELAAAEQELNAGEQALVGLQNGGEVYTAQEKTNSDLRSKVEQIRGDRNTYLALYQSKERFVIELETHETAQVKLRDNQRIWITILKSDTQERVTTFKSRLEAMKGMSDQDVARNLDKLGTEIDARNTEFMATAGAVSDRIRVDMMEANPNRVKRLTEAQAAQAKAHAEILGREGKLIEDFRKKYGIDPLDTSFFTYQQPDSSGNAGAPEGEPAEASV